MTVATRFHNFQTLGAPLAVDVFATARKTSPNLIAIHNDLKGKHGGQLLGMAPYPRPIVGGSSRSTHTWGALDWRYQSPGPGRNALLGEILPDLIDNSLEYHVQAIHDYVGSRIWRAGRGWKAQAKGSQMGQSWALWIHVESHPDGWFDGSPLAQRVAPPPQWPPFDPAQGLFGLWPLNTGKVRIGAFTIDDSVAYAKGVFRFHVGRFASWFGNHPAYSFLTEHERALLIWTAALCDQIVVDRAFDGHFYETVKSAQMAFGGKTFDGRAVGPLDVDGLIGTRQMWPFLDSVADGVWA